MANILVCDDDKEIVEAISIYLSQEGYQIFKAYNGREAIEVLQKEDIQLLLIDIMMPEMDGIHAMIKIRTFSAIPILVLSAKSEDVDKILGLNVGADDYIMKPFDSKEMVARVKAVLRRYQTAKPQTPATASIKMVTYADLEVNLSNYSVVYMGENIDMPPKELELLYFLAASPNQVFTREQLLDNIWGYEYIGDTRTVDVHVKRLREKIKDHAGWGITTVWGIGYKFEVKD